MELIIFVAALVVVGLLAMHFGYDSRVAVGSKEEDLAALGVTSGLQRTDPCGTHGDAAQRLDGLTHSLRRRVPVQQTVRRVLGALTG